MNMWLFGLGLALLCTVSAASECSKDFSKINGKWCMTAVGSTCEHFMKHHKEGELVMTEIITTEDEKVKIISEFPHKNGRKKIEMDFEKKEDGNYHHKSDWGEKKVEIVSTDCTSYVLFKVTIQKNGKTSTLLILMTKGCQLSHQNKEIFLKHAKTYLRDDQMKFLTEVTSQNEAME